MATLNPSERDALKTLRKGGLIQQEALDQLVRKKLAIATPLELTDAGRIVCELLLEIDTMRRDDDADTRGSY